MLKSVDYQTLKVKMFVRRGINEDRKLLFACMLENDEKFPPVTVYAQKDGTYLIEDGRHRLAGYEYFWHEHNTPLPHMVEVKIVDRPSDIDSFLEAIMANNPKGPLSMTRADKEYQVRQMFERGLKEPKIKALLKPIYGAETNRFVTLAKMRIEEAKRQRAVSFMIEKKFTVDEAAAAVGIKVEDLTRFMEGKKPRGTNDPELRDRKAQIRSRYKAHGDFVHRIMTKLFEQSESGEVTQEYVSEIMIEFAKKISQQSDQLRNWRDRFSQRREYAIAAMPTHTVVETPAGIVMKPI